MSEPNPNNNNNNQQDNPPAGTQQNAPAFDYEKLASIINGKQSVTEDTVLKSYFKQQGLSPEEMEQAINSFKEQKAKNTPDVAKMQSDLTSANTARMNAVIEKSAVLEAVRQGVNVKQVDYVLKLADFSNVADDKGAVDTEKLTEAIKKVLDDVPAFKSAQQNDGNGFQQIGGQGDNSSNKNEDDLIKKAFGL